MGQETEPRTTSGNIFANPDAYKDTVYVERYRYENIFYRSKQDDSTFQASDLWYEPTLSGEYLYADLGHIGSAHIKDYYQPDESIGIRYSYPQYNLYKYSTALPEYRINTAFTDLGFSQGLDQSQQAINATFAARYNQGKLDISYKRIKDQGTYVSQLNVHTAFHGRLSFDFKKVLLQLQLTSNIIQAQDNGGFVADSLFPPPFSTLVSDVPVKLRRSAETRHQEKHYIIRDYWPINGRLQDSSFLVFKHEFSYNNRYVRFFDTDPHPAYYPLDLYDDRGLRYFVKNNSINNSFQLLWRTSKLTWLKGQVNAGLQHQWHFIEQNLHERNRHWIALDGKLQTNLGNVARLESGLIQSIFPDPDDTRFMNSIDIGWRKYFNFHGDINFIRHRAAINEEAFHLNTIALWDDGLVPENTIQIGGALDISPINARMGIEYSRISNLIYYDASWRRQQAVEAIDMMRTYISTSFNYNFIHLDSETSLQLNQHALLPYARLVSDIRLYGQFRLFQKKMRLTTGPYGKYYTQPHGFTYVPVIGQFVLTDTQHRSSPYQLNYMLAFQVQSLSVYAHITGIQSFWDSRGFYELQEYAHPVVGLRFGLSWKLYN